MAAVYTAPCSWSVFAARDRHHNNIGCSSETQFVQAFRFTSTERSVRLQAQSNPKIVQISRPSILSSQFYPLVAEFRLLSRSAGRNAGRGRTVTRAGAKKSDSTSKFDSGEPTDGNVGDQKASLNRALERWWRKFTKQLKGELGVDAQEAAKQFGELAEDSGEVAGLARETAEAALKEDLPQTVNVIKGQLQSFKDVRQWSAKRWAFFLLALALGVAAARGSYRVAVAGPRKVEAAAESWMDLAVPDPTPENLLRLKRAVWRRSNPAGYTESRLVKGEDGKWYRDMEYEGETAWQDRQGGGAEAVEERVPSGATPAKERVPWRERMSEWDALLRIEEWKEALSEGRTRKVPHADLAQLKASSLRQLDRRSSVGGENSVGFWVSKRWWKYRPSMPYTWLLQAVEREEVAHAVYSEDLRHLVVKMRQGVPDEFRVQIPLDPYLYEDLLQRGVQLGHLPRHPLSFLRPMAVLAPSLALFSLILCLQYALRQQLDESLSDLVRMDRQQLLMPGDTEDGYRSGYGDVIMGPEVWQVLEEVLTYMKDPMAYYDRGVKLPRGILISGPPGTGKTLLARAIAREAGLPFVFASGAEFADTSGGAGMDKVFETFLTARANAPSFVFIDEIDAVAGKNCEESSDRMAIFRQLLAELDGAAEDTDIDRFSPRQAWILIAATNRPEELHDALMQGGRIDREIHIGLPAEAERVQIFGVHSKGRKMGADVDFSKLAFRTLGFSGADLRNLVNEAAILTARDGRSEICQDDIRSALDKQLFEGLGISLTAQEEQEAFRSVPTPTRRLLAVHEAGHVLLSHLLPSFDYHAFTHILPGGEEGGLSVYYPRQEMVEGGESSTGYLRQQMIVAHGGRCAEKLVFGEEQLTDGGGDDLLRISRMARELTVSSTNPRLGLLPLTFQPRLDPPEVAGEPNLIPNQWTKAGTQVAQMSPPLAETFTREVRRYMDETEEAAMKALVRNRTILDRLAEELYERFRISGVEAERLIGSMGPVMMDDPMAPPTLDPHEGGGWGGGVDPLSLDPNKPGGYEYLDIYPAPLHRC